ncbi:hypothetical protein [Nocardia sp. CDC160]|uniref:hypothetical protein n=1 Tax=Nocardia sp. CDC160 TaxID=3112166 RepID=UPI002DB98C17|nr:hypothetical protein [Nocardia sp. CDC160]MEC3920275.1 hypothetical protein [Nocardia sp. CDC160]
MTGTADPVRFGMIVRAARRRRGLTQDDIPGLGSTRVRELEKGLGGIPRKETTDALDAVFGWRRGAAREAYFGGSNPDEDARHRRRRAAQSRGAVGEPAEVPASPRVQRIASRLAEMTPAQLDQVEIAFRLAEMTPAQRDQMDTLVDLVKQMGRDAQGSED